MDDQPFLSAILCAPDNDTPRLVYADWLEERGQTERAAFIRVQCELARLTANDYERKALEWTSDPTIMAASPTAVAVHRRTLNKIAALRRRERELLESHAYLWLPPFPCQWSCHVNQDLSVMIRVPSDQLDFIFRRGFIESISCTAEAWRKYGKQIVRCQPIREVRLTRITSEEAKMFDPFAFVNEPYRSFDRLATSRAVLAWARQEPCSAKPCILARVDVATMTCIESCPVCKGRGSVDFRTLLGKPAPA